MGGAGLLRMKGSLHCDGEHLRVSAAKGRPHSAKVNVVAQDPVLQHRQVLYFVGLDLDEAAMRSEVQHHLLTKDSIIATGAAAAAAAGGAAGGGHGDIVCDANKKRALITVESLQEQDVEDISTSMSHRSLPSGWYHDGLMYVHTGDELYQKLRPDVEELKAEYVRNYNAGVEAHNAAIESGHQWSAG